MLVTLATGRGLMLVGNRAPQNLSCLNYWQPSISGDAGLTIQAAHLLLKIKWNYALLINHGPSTEALVPRPALPGNARRQNRPF